MASDYDCIPLTRELMNQLWPAFASIDAPFVDGGLLEAWLQEHYMMELVDKWAMSHAVLIGKHVIGYRIVSGHGKRAGYAHSHRTAVDGPYRLQGYARLLLENAQEVGAELGYIGITGLRHPGNDSSLQFLMHTGWKFAGEYINGNELWTLDF